MEYKSLETTMRYLHFIRKGQEDVYEIINSFRFGFFYDRSWCHRPRPASTYKKGVAPPGLAAYIAVAKYCDSLPLYRQEKMFERLNIHIPRETMGRWIMKVSGNIEPLIELFDE